MDSLVMDVLSLSLMCFHQVFSPLAPVSSSRYLSPLERQGTAWRSLFFSCLQKKSVLPHVKRKSLGGNLPLPSTFWHWAHCLSLLVAGPFSPGLVTVSRVSFAAFCGSLLQSGHGHITHTVEGNLLTFWTGYSMPVKDVT